MGRLSACSVVASGLALLVGCGDIPPQAEEDVDPREDATINGLTNAHPAMGVL